VVTVSSHLRLALVAAASALASAAGMAALAPQPLRLANLQAQAAPASAPGRLSIPKSADGHFWAQAQVNGAPVRVLVDTGATAVALTPADAARLGLRPAELKYGYQVTTAAGGTRAAAVRLASVTVGGARLTDVDALVVEKGLDTSLLGMSYLGRLSRFTATKTALTLEP
jgi:aspartyl protease family protein